MKKLLVAALIFLSFSAYSQNTGLGFRFGDPSGLTFKKYFGSKALEISLGRSYMFYGDKWYNDHFDHWYKNKNFYYDEYVYYGYDRASFPFGLQVHYLFQKAIKGTDSDVGTLDWYIGVGGQFRILSYKYYYDYKIDGIWHTQTERVTDFDIGADGVIGLEYKFSNAPFAVFLDFTLDMELYDDPFIFWGQPGIGLRYNF